MFFHVSCRGPAWALGSYNISQSAGGTSQKIIFKTLRQIGLPALYMSSEIIGYLLRGILTNLINLVYVQWTGHLIPSPLTKVCNWLHVT